jgi:hypothetical protein
MLQQRFSEFFQVIVVDWNPNSVALNRDNALLLKKWEGDNTDRHLIGLAQLLQGFLLFLFYYKSFFSVLP